jgi:hypothetical protein
MVLGARDRKIVSRVQDVCDERDALLELLDSVVAGHITEDSETAVAVIPVGLMNEIRRHVARNN